MGHPPSRPSPVGLLSVTSRPTSLVTSRGQPRSVRGLVWDPMRNPRFRPFAGLLVASATVAIGVPSQEGSTLQRVGVFLNDRYLVSADARLSPRNFSLGLDRSWVRYAEIERVLAGRQYLHRSGTNLDAVMPGAGTGAQLRVQRRGRLSSRLHRSGDQESIPLLDLVRALGASIEHNDADRINLVLKASRPDAILALNDPLQRRRR